MVHLAIHRLDASSVLHMLHDFLFIAKTKDRCEADLGSFIRYAIISMLLYTEKAAALDVILSICSEFYQIGTTYFSLEYVVHHTTTI